MSLFNWLSEIRRRARMLVSREQFDRELEEEMRLHRELREQQQVQVGVSLEEARLVARRRFGNATLLKETSRAMWGWTWLEDFFHDLSHGVRILRKTPGFTAVAVLTLALGIGANTAIFSVVNALILRPLPVEKPATLVQFLRHGWFGTGSHFSYPDFEELRDRNHVLAGASVVFWVNPVLLDARWNGEPENVAGQMVSGNFFALLGVHPSPARLITPDVGRIPGGSQVAVLSYSYWQRRFHNDPSVLGKSILLRQRPFTIAGVAPADFGGIAPGYAPDLYIPIATEPVIHDEKTWLDKQTYSWIQIVAALRPGLPLPKAQTAP